MLLAYLFAALAAISGGFLPFARAQTAALDALPPQLGEKLAQVNWTPELTSQFITAMPKIETHLHLDGTLSAETVFDLVQKLQYKPFLGKSLEEIRKLAVVSDPRESLGAVLEAFGNIYPLLHTPDALEEVAYDLTASLRAQNIRYAEVRFAPILLATPDFPMEEVLKAVLRGLDKGKKTYGVKTSVIICLYRPRTLEENRAQLRLAEKYFGRGVSALDLAGDEAKNPLSETADLFREARTLGIPFGPHAKEVPGSQDLELALKLGASRIGHGTMLVENPELMKEVARRKIMIEVSLTSNVRTGAIKNYKDHPARIFFDAGIPISLSPDDPGVFGIKLADEYMILIKELHFTIPEVVATIFQTIDSLYITPEEKSQMKREFLGDIGSLADRILRESGQ